MAQLARIKAALFSGASHVLNMSDKEMLENGFSEMNRLKTKSLLTHAHGTLLASEKMDDVKTRSIFGSIPEAQRTAVAKVLMENRLHMLSLVGRQPISEIKKKFEEAGLVCPMALIVFHSEYQKLLSVPNETPVKQVQSECLA
jgi:hypothetical protein